MTTVENSKTLNKTRFQRFLTGKLFISVITNLIVMGIIFLCTNMTYETNDDFALSNTVGTLGNCNVRFVNYYLCKIIYFLQQQLQFVNVVVGLQVFFSFISFVIITYIFLDKSKSRFFTISGLILLAVFSYDHYCVIQFTKTSALLLTTALLLFVHTVLYRKKTAFTLIGLVLAYVGAGFRFTNVYVAGAFAVVFLLLYLFLDFKKAKIAIQETLEPKRLIAIIICFVVFLGTFAVHEMSKTVNQSTDELKAYAEYNRYRTQLMDYGVPYYADNQEFYDDMGFSKDDVALLRAWYLDFDSIASIDNIKKIINNRDAVEKSVYKDGIKACVKGIKTSIKEVKRSGYHIVLLLLFVLAGIALFRPKWLIYAGALGVISLVLYCYLYYLGRTVYRGTYVIDLCAMVWLFYSIDESYYREFLKDKQKILRYGGLVVVMVLMVTSAIIFQQAQEVSDRGKNLNADALWKYTSAKMENLYVFDVPSSFGYAEKLSFYNEPLKPLPKTYNVNTMKFGGWSTNSPYMKEKLKTYGLRNLYGDIIDNDRVYVIDNGDIKKRESFFNSHYGKPDKKIYYHLIDEVGGLKIWQVRTK